MKTTNYKNHLYIQVAFEFVKQKGGVRESGLPDNTFHDTGHLARAVVPITNGNITTVKRSVFVQ